MARKISGGLTGQPGFVSVLQISPQAVISSGSNQNITFDPGGTATVVFESAAEVREGQKLRFFDVDSSNSVSLRAPDTVSADIILELPSADGTENQSLITNGAGQLSWRTPTIAVATETSDTNTNYLLFTTTTSGDIDTADVSTSGARFIPGTGNLINPVITGNTSASGTLTLRSTTNATKGQVYIDENTASTSTSTGALRVAGGVGIGGAAYIGTTLSVGGQTSGVLGYTVITGTSTLQDVDYLLLVRSTSAFNITLPSTPTLKRTIVIEDGLNFSRNNVTVVRNGNTIAGLDENLVLDVSGSVKLVWDGSTWQTSVL